MRKKIIVIGGGISGLGLLHVLSKYTDHEVVLLEKETYVGGHAHAVPFEEDMVDTGFMVFNKKTYPNIIRLFKELGVKIHKTDMSFCSYNEKEGFSFSSLRAQSSLLYIVRHCSVIWGIMMLHRKVRRDITRKKVGPEETIGSYLDRIQASPRIVDGYFLPMISSVWSQMDGVDVKEMPAQQIFNFLNNHQLLNYTRPEWFSVAGSSATYVDRLIEMYGDQIRSGVDVERVLGDLQKEVVYLHKGERYTLTSDIVVFACHSDQISTMVDNLSVEQKEIIKKILYRKTEVVLHTDVHFMPPEQSLWCSWNFIVCPQSGEHYCTYWLNALQQLKTTQDIFITVNPTRDVDQKHLIETYNYAHPVFTPGTHSAQKELPETQGQNGYYFAGAWTRHGFHEDGLWSALKVYQAIEGNVPPEYQL